MPSSRSTVIQHRSSPVLRDLPPSQAFGSCLAAHAPGSQRIGLTIAASIPGTEPGIPRIGRGVTWANKMGKRDAKPLTVIVTNRN